MASPGIGLGLAMRGIAKAFPGVQALDGADLTVTAGEIHGLVGENGAGKSTIIKILAGVYARDAGTVRLGEQEVEAITPGLVHGLGVRFIHQELQLVPHFTVAEAIFVGQERRARFGPWLDRAGMRAAAERFLADALHAEIDGRTLIRDLGVAQRKLVQIARALIDGAARLVVFDEPTAPLAADEVAQLFRSIRRLRESGITMIYVSHYIGEITEICDAVTVFRSGRDVGLLRPVGAADGDAIIRLMVGRELGRMFPPKRPQMPDPALVCEGIGDGARFADVGLTVGAGEIVGLAGLEGSGREEVVEALFGLRRLASGRITLDGAPIRLDGPAEAMAHGFALVPRDRRHVGLVLDMTVADNVNLASLDEVAVLGLERPAAAGRRAAELAARLDIRPPEPGKVVKFLSGGNQQKVVLARWLATGARIFILDEPTVGVDIGAKVEIYRLVADLASRGASVIVSSSDGAELLGLCDRIVVMLRGRAVATRDTAKLGLDALLALTSGSAGPDGLAA